ncbi:MAG: hypothetical protein GYA14_10490 [Ignavibacteria bacterium]|nr:hypothetical protein [Ignavibacteria bacterium]
MPNTAIKLTGTDRYRSRNYVNKKPTEKNKFSSTGSLSPGYALLCTG